MRTRWTQPGESVALRASAPSANGGVGAIRQLDATEFLNVSKDDALAFPNVVHRAYPAPVTVAIPTVVGPFVRKSLDINKMIIRIFNDKLGLPEGTLERLHSDEEHSGSEARIIKVPPMPEQVVADTVTLGAHTDFGSLVSRNAFEHTVTTLYKLIFGNS